MLCYLFSYLIKYFQSTWSIILIILLEVSTLVLKPAYKEPILAEHEIKRNWVNMSENSNWKV